MTRLLLEASSESLEGFIPFSKDCKTNWRQNNDDDDDGRTKSDGISPRDFYNDSNNSMVKSKRKVHEGRMLVKMNEKRQKILDFHKKYYAFKAESFYREFPLQNLAFAALDELVSNGKNVENNKGSQQRTMQLMWDVTPRIFATETSKSGKRKYVVCHLGRFMHRYWRHCPPYARHFYELIREDVPCRLYFDLEYNKEANEQLSQDEDANRKLMQQFIQQLIFEIKSQFNIDIHPRNIVDLDSSTSSKFSRHLMIHMPRGELFGNAMDCGVFVKNFVGRLVEEIVTDTMDDHEYDALKKYFLVNSSTQSEQRQQRQEGKEDQEQDPHQNVHNHAALLQKTPFVDIGVYTRNRLFRLLGSSKYGKPVNAALRIADSNQFPFPEDFGNHKFYKPDMEQSSLQEGLCREKRDICLRSDGEERMEDVDLDDFDQDVLNWESYALALEQTFVTPSHIDDKTIILDMSHHDCSSSGGIMKSKQMGSPCCVTNHQVGGMHVQNHSSRMKSSSRFSNHLGPSPFPALEQFIGKFLASRKGISGAIRAWTIDSTFASNRDEFMENGGIIIYQMKNNRWCENIQRCHKSNNIMWNVSLVNMTYWQTCHDPECRMVGFRGEVQKLPVNIVNDTRQILTEELLHHNTAAEATTTSGLQNCSETDLNHVLQDKDDDVFAECIQHELMVHPERFP